MSIRSLVVLLLVLTGNFCSPFSLLKTSSKKVRKPVALEDVLSHKFMTPSFNGSWVSDHEIEYLSESGSLTEYNAKTGKHRTLVPYFEMFMYDDHKFSPDKKKILFKYDTVSVFRYTEVARYDIYDMESKMITKVANGSLIQNCLWSPTSDSLAFVVDNNLFIRTPSEEEVQVTTDGKPGIVYNGVPDWVYEEEVLYSGGAMWFSPDGKKLAFAHFNDTEVLDFPLVQYEQAELKFPQYPFENLLKYPKAGTPNPTVELRLFDIEKPKEKWTLIQPPTSIVTEDHILLTVTWSDPQSLLPYWSNRRQNLGSLQKCDVKGECDEIIRLEEPDGWLMFGPLKCGKSGRNCLMLNWMDDLLQIWNIDLAKKENVGKPLGNFTVTKVYGYREETGDVFFEAAPRDLPMEQHVYKNKKCLSCNVTFDDGTPCTYASAEFSKNFTYYTLTCKGPVLEYIKVLSTDDNSVVTMWEKSEEIRKDLEGYELPQIKYVEVDVEGGHKAIVQLTLPAEVDFDDKKPSKQYPLIVSVYGGPNSVRVTDSLSITWDTYLVTSKKVIYAIIDGRGSGNKGRKMLYEINNRLGTVEVEDQLAVTKHLQEKLPFVDSKRTGIWGWSYGGYVSAMALAKDKEQIFKCGISVAPVTSWVFYDSIYTERFMGLPTPSDNLANYLAGDVSKQVDGFKTHDYMLIHGSGDDNVHYQQSMILSRALQLADVDFEQMFYPDEAHSLSHVRKHLYHTMDHFWSKCFNLEHVKE